MNAEIITIGDEILIGQVMDTNSAWMAEHLNLAGIRVTRITTVPDQHDPILSALDPAEKNADVVLITGGLGPTSDDITKGALCEYFGTELVFHSPTFDRISDRFQKRGIPVNKLNRDQALVPASCTVIPNLNGTAPALFFERNKTMFVAMPGVPFEMKGIMNEHVLPLLNSMAGRKTIIHKTVLTQGIPESLLAEKIEKWEKSLPNEIKLAYLPSPASVRLRLSGSGDHPEQLALEINKQIGNLLLLIPQYVFGFDKDTLSQAVGRLLLGKNCTLSVAESCTGGLISHLITLTAGSSKWFKGGVTAYSNELKTSLLGVSPDLLEQFGAVSRETAVEMATGVKKRLNTDYAIATTGIAGPDGGSHEKPVGTLWIAVAGPAKFFCRKYVFNYNRERFVNVAAQTALQMMRNLLSNTLTEE